MSEEVLMIVNPAPARRYIALGILGVLGFLLAYLGFSVQGMIVGRIVLIIAGGLSIWATTRMFLATSRSIELTQDELRETSGEVIARLENIKKIDRGTFAFKPSNGFIIILNAPMNRNWRPGLWWRTGRRIGIGGVTNAGQNKALAEILTVEVAKRDASL